MSKGKGAGDAGYSYERKVCVIVALRLCLDENIEYFKIKMNDPKVDTFDDVIVNYKIVDDGRPYTIYVQLKHKFQAIIQNQAFYDTRGDFSIPKYYKAFETIKNSEILKWCDIDRDHETFVLYTNAQLDPKKCKGVQSSSDHQFCQSLLRTGQGQVYNFGTDQDLLRVLTGDDKQKNKFVSNFLLFVSQSSEFDIDVGIKQAVQNLLKYQCSESKIDEVILKLVNFINCRSERFKSNEPFTKEEMFNVLLQYYMEASLPEDEPVDSEVANDWKTISHKKRLIISARYDKKYINIIKQGVKMGNDNNILHLNLKNALMLNYLPNVWPQIRYSTLILQTGNEIDEAELWFLRKLIDILVNFNKLRLIVICQNFNANLNELLDDDAIKNLTKLITLSDVCEDSLVFEKSLQYYGKDVTVQEIIDENSELVECFKTHHLLELLDNNLVIGEPHENFIDFYIERKIKITAVKSEIFQREHFGRNIVCLSGDFAEFMINSKLLCVEHEEIKNAKRLDSINIITFLGDSDIKLKEFRQLRERFPKYDLFLIHAKKIKENGTILKLIVPPRNPDFDIDRYLTEEVIFLKDIEMKNSTTLLTGEPGMGKTTFCDYIVGKKKIPFLKISHDEFGKENSLDSIFKKFKQNKNDITVDIFNCHCRSRNLLIIVDAFDEIFNKSEALRMIDEMLIENCSLLITTRPVNTHLLEQKLQVTSQKLEPFSGEQQIEFLKNKWIESLKLNSSHFEKITTFGKKLLKIAKISISDFEHSITGIPLQCLMIANIFEKQCELFSKSNETLENLLPTRLDIVEIYQQFIDTKIEIFCRDKMKLNQKANLHLKGTISNSESETCKKYAILSVFGIECPYINFKDFKLSNKIKYEEYCIGGIITKFQTQAINAIKINFPIFVHKTYAEYFVALYLSENLKSETELIELLFEKRDFDTVRYFFDLILSRNCPLISAVIRNDIDEIYNTLENTSERDRGGRTALHLAASRGFRPYDYGKDRHDYIKSFDRCISNKHFTYPCSMKVYSVEEEECYLRENNITICKLLLGKGIDVSATDEILKWNALKYADAVMSLHVLNELIRFKPAKIDVKQTMTMLKAQLNMSNEHKTICGNTFFKTSTLIHYMTLNRHNNILKYMRDMSKRESISMVNLINCENSSGYTPLECAVMADYLDTVCVLIEIGADLKRANGKHKSSILHIAAYFNRDKILEYLFINNPSVQQLVNCENEFKRRTPLYYAVEQGHLNTVKILLKFGADIHSIDQEGESILHRAIKSDATDVINYLLTEMGTRSEVNLKTENIGRRQKRSWQKSRRSL